MDFTKTTNLEDLTVSHSYQSIDENGNIISGTIQVNKKSSQISFSLYKIIDEIAYNEGVHHHPWFLQELFDLKEEMILEKKLTGIFAS